MISGDTYLLAMDKPSLAIKKSGQVSGKPLIIIRILLEQVILKTPTAKRLNTKVILGNNKHGQVIMSKRI